MPEGKWTRKATTGVVRLNQQVNHCSLNMDAGTGFCLAASLVFVSALAWKLKRGSASEICAATFVASLYWIVPPVVHGLLLLVYSSILVWVTSGRSKLLPVKNRAVLVTGCDSGFGHELARRLSGMGVLVFAGVLDANGAGARKLREETSGTLQVLQLDVTNDEQIKAARRCICAQVAGAGLWGLVNNAGILHYPADAELQPITSFRLYMEVNFLGAVKMSQVFLPLLRRSRGRIVNMTSMAGEVPIPLFSAYGASKAALAVYSKAMRLELSAWGVRVSLIQPSGFRTNIFGNSDDVPRYRDQLLAALPSDVREDYGDAYISSLPSSLSRMSQQCPADLSPVVDAMCQALFALRPAPVYTPGQMAWLLPFLQRCCPSVAFDLITMKLLRVADRQPAGTVRPPGSLKQRSR